MKNIFLILLGLIAIHSAAFAETYAVKADDSSAKWTASKVTGKHNGTIKVLSGNIEFTDGKFSGGEAVIDVSSLSVEDLKGQGKDKLTAHLKSADFFDVANYPQAAIKITDVQPAGENLYDVTADITIKSITKPAKFQAKVEPKGNGVEANAKISLDRTEYDIRYGSGKFFEDLGDRTIHDNFDVEVSIKAA